MAKQETLAIRLYFTPALYELARLVSYGGIFEEALRAQLKPLEGKYGRQEMMWAVFELTATDEKSRLVTLKADARKACWQLLGPPPEHALYASYWSARTPPLNHLPPQREVVREKLKRVRKRKV